MAMTGFPPSKDIVVAGSRVITAFFKIVSSLAYSKLRIMCEGSAVASVAYPLVRNQGL